MDEHEGANMERGADHRPAGAAPSPARSGGTGVTHLVHLENLAGGSTVDSAKLTTRSLSIRGSVGVGIINTRFKVTTSAPGLRGRCDSSGTRPGECPRMNRATLRSATGGRPDGLCMAANGECKDRDLRA